MDCTGFYGNQSIKYVTWAALVPFLIAAYEVFVPQILAGVFALAPRAQLLKRAARFAHLDETAIFITLWEM